jgi:hypothetical protein
MTCDIPATRVEPPKSTRPPEGGLAQESIR